MGVQGQIFGQRILIWALLVFIPMGSYALDFPPLFRRTRALGMGETSLSISGIRIDQRAQFNRNGNRVSDSEGFLLRELTWGQLIEQATGEAEKENLRLQQQSEGQSSEDVALRERISTIGERMVVRPFWAFGLSDRWTIGAQVGIIAERRRVIQRWEWSKSYSGFQSSALSIRGVEGSHFLEPEKVNSEPAIEGLESGMRYHIGDVEILGHYVLREAPDWSWVLRQKVVLPTSPPPDPYNIDPFVVSEGQTDVGLDSLWQWWLASGWSVSMSLGYLLQLPDSVPMRMHDSKRPFVESEIDKNVIRDPGEKSTAEILVNRRWRQSWDLRTGLAYAAKTSDHFSGKVFESSQYHALSLGTETKSVEGRLGLSYDLGEQKSIWNRGLRLLGIHLDLSSPFWGINISANPSVELGVAFAY